MGLSDAARAIGPAQAKLFGFTGQTHLNRLRSSASALPPCSAATRELIDSERPYLGTVTFFGRGTVVHYGGKDKKTDD